MEKTGTNYYTLDSLPMSDDVTQPACLVTLILPDIDYILSLFFAITCQQHEMQKSINLHKFILHNFVPSM